MKKLIQGFLGYLLTLLLTVFLIAACLLTLAEQLLTNQALHERVAVKPQVVDAQMARVEETVSELAEAYHFAPETVLNVVTRDALEAYGRSMTAWWMGLLDSDPDLDAPFPDSAAIEEAVCADELFRESTEDFMRRTIARDKVAYRVCQAMQDAVMPIRLSLVSLAMPHLTSRNLSGIIGLLPTGRTILLGAAAVLFLLLMLIEGRSRFLYGSVGLLAPFALLAAMTVLAAVANLPGLLASFSQPLAVQLGLLEAELLPIILAMEGALLLIGLVLLALAVKSAPAKRSRA